MLPRRKKTRVVWRGTRPIARYEVTAQLPIAFEIEVGVTATLDIAFRVGVPGPAGMRRLASGPFISGYDARRALSPQPPNWSSY
jgi:hypothetical protein